MSGIDPNLTNAKHGIHERIARIARRIHQLERTITWWEDSDRQQAYSGIAPHDIADILDVLSLEVDTLVTELKLELDNLRRLEEQS